MHTICNCVHSHSSASHSYSDNSGDSDRGSSYSATEGGGRGYAKGGASPERAGGEGKEEADMGGGKRDPYADDLFEPFSPVNSPDHLFDLLDEDGKRVSLAIMHLCTYYRVTIKLAGETSGCLYFVIVIGTFTYI